MRHPCSGCYYWRTLRYGTGSPALRVGACHYLLFRGKMRGCKPGAGCLRREERRLEKGASHEA